VKVVADTNVLVRAVVRDDQNQAAAAVALLREASAIIVPMPCLCEFVWVLKRVYKFDNAAIAAAIRSLVSADNVRVETELCEPALTVLEAGGDFADGAIAAEGTALGGETFVSFDKRAVNLVGRAGISARLL